MSEKKEQNKIENSYCNPTKIYINKKYTTKKKRKTKTKTKKKN